MQKLVIKGREVQEELIHSCFLQEYDDETGRIRLALLDLGGFAGLKRQAGTAQKAFAGLEPLLSKVVGNLMWPSFKQDEEFGR